MPTATVDPAASFDPSHFEGLGKTPDVKAVSLDGSVVKTPDHVNPDFKPAEPPPEKKVEAKVEVKVENKKIEPFQDPNKVKEEPEHPEAKEDGKPKRDYNSIPEHLRGIAKRAGNQEFNALTNLLKEHSELKKRAEGAIPDSYYEHPAAYQLTPEFQQLNQTYNQSSAEAAHWQQQIIKIREGKDWEDLQEDAKGNIIRVKVPARKDPTTGENVVDHAAELEVMKWYQTANSLVQNSKAKAAAIQQNFSGRATEYSKALLSEADRLFPHMAAEDNPYKDKIAEIMSVIPEWKLHDPMAVMAARAGTQCLIYKQMVEDLRKQLDVKTAQNTMRSAAQPSSATIAAGGAGKPTESGGILDPKEFVF